MDVEKTKEQLTERLTENYNDYQAALLTNDRQELIDMARQIADTASVYQHLTERSYNEQELSYFLQFQNPLEVIMDSLKDDHLSADALDSRIADMAERQEELSMYPLMKETRPEPMRKFMNVDISKALHQILEETTAFYKDDLDIALKVMQEGLDSGSPDKRNFVVFFRESGVECMNERDMFIRDTRDFNTCQHFHYNSTPVSAYAVEITGGECGKLRGNLYQRDNHQLAKYANHMASERAGVTLIFPNNKEVTISKADDNWQTRKDLAYDNGKIIDERNEPEDESKVRGAVRQEHERRERLPRGRFSSHLQKLSVQKIQTEVAQIASGLQNLTSKDFPRKAKQTVDFSSGFFKISGKDGIDQVMKKLQDKFPKLCPVLIKGEHPWQYQVKIKTPELVVEKPSIKARLAVKPEQPEQTKVKPRVQDKGAR